MTQKNSENIYKALKEEERTLLEKNVTWMEKAFKRKEGYVTFGNRKQRQKRFGKFYPTTVPQRIR